MQAYWKVFAVALCHFSSLSALSMTIFSMILTSLNIAPSCVISGTAISRPWRPSFPAMLSHATLIIAQMMSVKGNDEALITRPRHCSSPTCGTECVQKGIFATVRTYPTVKFRPFATKRIVLCSETLPRHSSLFQLHYNPRSVKDKARRHTASWERGRCPRAGLQSAPGRLGHHVSRHYDRGGRCFPGLGQAKAGNARSDHVPGSLA